MSWREEEPPSTEVLRFVESVSPLARSAQSTLREVIEEVKAATSAQGEEWSFRTPSMLVGRIDPREGAALWLAALANRGDWHPRAPFLLRPAVLAGATSAATLVREAVELAWKFGAPRVVKDEYLARVAATGEPTPWLGLCARALDSQWPHLAPAVLAVSVAHAGALLAVDDPAIRVATGLIERCANLDPATLLYVSSLERHEFGVEAPGLVGRRMASEIVRSWRATDPERLVLVRDPIGADFLVAAAQVHAARKLGTVKFDDYYGQDEALGAVLEWGRAVREPTDDLDEIGRQLRAVPRASLLALLPLATRERPLVLRALGMEDAERLCSLITNGGTILWTSEEGVPDPIDADEARAAWSAVGEKAGKAVVTAFRKARLGARRTVLIEAAVGRKSDWIEERWPKRDRIAVMALGVAPLTDGLAEAVERHRRLLQFRRESKQFGSSKRPAEELAVDRALDTLARQVELSAGQLALVAASAGASPFPRGWAFDADIEVSLHVERGRPELVVRRAGAVLASAPKAVRSLSQWSEIESSAREAKERWRSAVEIFEAFMVAGVPIDRSLGGRLAGDGLVVALLRNTIGTGADGVVGLVDLAGGRLLTIDGPDRTLTFPLLIAHPHHLDQAIEQWQMRLVATGAIQPFAQAFRQLYLPAETETDRTMRFAGRSIDTRRAAGLFKQRGWGGPDGEGEPLYRRFPMRELRVEWEMEGLQHYTSLERAVRTGPIWFRGEGSPGRLPLEDVPPTIYSEACRDADLVLSLAPAGEAALDPMAPAEPSQEVALRRRQLIAALLRRDGLDNVSIDGHWATIRGSRQTYKVNLNAGVAFINTPRRALAIPDGLLGADLELRFAPSADHADPILSHTLELVRLFADDGSITSAQLLEQIER